MAEQNVGHATEERKADSLADAMCKAFLAGIGALDLAREEVEKTVERLAARGEKARRERRERLREALARRRARLGRLEAKVDRGLNALVRRLNVPTKGDIEALNAKVEELSRKIDALQGTPPAT